MDVGLLSRIFGREQRWHGTCTVIMDGEASVQTMGVDSILGGGAKQFAPRMISGRIIADSLCLLQDASGLLILQQQKVRLPTGEEAIRQQLTIADPAHVVAIEFPDATMLAVLGLAAPVVRPSITGSHSGILSRPQL